MTKLRYLIGAMILPTVLAIALGGCSRGDAVNKENYDQVKTGSDGMSVEQVEGVLGKGTVEQSSGVETPDIKASMQTRTWKSGSKKVTVQFVNGKAAVKTQSGL